MTRIRHSFHSACPRLIPKKAATTACPICHKEVLIETAKTDEDGRALHKECYLFRLRLKGLTTPTDGVA